MKEVYNQMNELDKCPICGGEDFESHIVLWDELIDEWGLNEYEVNYINRQQGLFCCQCKCNLRSMAIAFAILQLYEFHGTFVKFIDCRLAKKIKLLEINEAGGLNIFLRKLANHRLISYPEYDVMNLNTIDNSTYDLIIHSDTLEHVSDPIAGLKECYRILKHNGVCIFTVPIIYGRLTRHRKGLKNSYHGTKGALTYDLLVHYEFGADVWKFLFEAGFNNATMHCLEFPGGISISAKKI